MSVEADKVRKIIEAVGNIWFDPNSKNEVDGQLIRGAKDGGMVDKYRLALATLTDR